MKNLWRELYSSLVDENNYALELLGDFLNGVVSHPKYYQNFFDHAINGEFYQFYESHFICLPEDLIDDGEYNGSVKIVWDNFDGNDYFGWIRLDKFCFFVKLSAIYHAKHVDASFDPWEGFKKLDELLRVYRDYKSE